MLSKAIRRLSFRSIANEETAKEEQVDKNNNHSNDSHLQKGFIASPMPLKPTTDNIPAWSTGLWTAFQSQNSARDQHSYVESCPYTEDCSPVPMACKCVLRSCGAGSYVLSVLLVRARRLSRVESVEGEIVACSSVSKNMKPGGSIKVHLASSVFDMDTAIDAESTKREPQWNGCDLEKEFVLRAKNENLVGGILGKVTVEQEDDGNISSPFQLTLVSKKHNNNTGDLSWGAAGFRELASLLHLVDENDDFNHLAKDLGFTEFEIYTKLLVSDDPFAAMLKTYEGRGGTPIELVQAMYSCSRLRGLSLVGGSPTPLNRAVSQCSVSSAAFTSNTGCCGTIPPNDEDLEDLQEAAVLAMSPVNLRKRKLSEAKSGGSYRAEKRARAEELESNEADDLCDAATIPVGDLEQGVDFGHLPPTPPATPLKRLTQSSQEEQANVFLYPYLA